jgi:hypothetical protein
VRYAGGLRKWEQKVEPTDIWWQLA